MKLFLSAMFSLFILSALFIGTAPHALGLEQDSTIDDGGPGYGEGDGGGGGGGGGGGTPPTTQTVPLQTQWVAGDCPAGWTDTQLIDHDGGSGHDGRGDNHHIGEEEPEGGWSRLCIRADAPDVTLSASWGGGSCPANMIFAQVYDDAGSYSHSNDLPSMHSLGEESSRPSNSHYYLWCLGASGGNNAVITVRWVQWSSSTHSPSCASGETRLISSRKGFRNLNTNDYHGSKQESLCAKVTVTIDDGEEEELVPPTVTLTPTPRSIVLTQSSNLTWSSANATSCTGTNFSTIGETSGTAVVSPPATTVYSVTCTGPGGTADASATVTVTTEAASEPDLTASSLSPSTATVGTPVTFSTVITNSGTASTGTGFTDLFQLATDSSGSDADDIGTFANAALSMGASNTATNAHTFASAGTYYLRACADKSSAGDGGDISESNEGNNCSAGGATAWTVVHVCSSGQAWNGSSCASSGSSLSCLVSPTSVAVNGSATYTASGATPPYTWTPSDPGGQLHDHGSDAVASRVFTADGVYGMTVSKSGYASGNCPTVTVGSGTSSCTNPIASLTAAPDRIRPNTHTTLSWTASGINTSCTITGPGVSQPATATSCLVTPGSVDTPNLTTQATYIMTCDGVERDRVIVNVVPNFEEF